LNFTEPLWSVSKIEWGTDCHLQHF
jgi:hypothetical protein